jgi:hypothetical protein
MASNGAVVSVDLMIETTIHTAAADEATGEASGVDANIEEQEATEIDSSGDPVVRWPVPRKEPAYIHTPFQEYMNAATMLIPLAMCVYYLVVEESSVWLRTFTAGVAVHLPFSMAYHVGCAHRAFKNEDENMFLQLDQTFIHVTNCFIALATSGSYLYAFQNGVANVCFIVTLWRYHPLDRLRQMNTFASVVLYTLPLLVREDWINFLSIWVCFVLCVGSLKLGKWDTPLPWLCYGWGHSWFHVLMLPYTWFLLKAISGTAAAVDEGNSRWYV